MDHRKILDVRDGVRVIEKATTLGLHDTDEISSWIRAIISLLFSEFVFLTDPLFEDATTWLRGLQQSKCKRSAYINIEKLLTAMQFANLPKWQK